MFFLACFKSGDEKGKEKGLRYGKGQLEEFVKGKKE